jgi:hypothetical protein
MLVTIYMYTTIHEHFLCMLTYLYNRTYLTTSASFSASNTCQLKSPEKGPALEGPVFYLDGSDGGTTKSLKQAGFRNDDLYSANLFQDTVDSLKVI